MKHYSALFFPLALALCFYSVLLPAAEGELLLRDNLKRAQAGDYLVTAQNKNYTILIVRSRDDDYLGIEEITVPSTKASEGKNFSWRKWVEGGAQGNTSWVLYYIQLASGNIQQTYSFTRKEWITIPQSQNFMSTLLNLRLNRIPDNERKKVGPPPSTGTPDRRTLWQPPMYSEGQQIPQTTFEAWRTRWPTDSSELSGRLIEVYLPQNSSKYPSYFPYWLQVYGAIGKAKVRIVDSGSHLTSPAKLP